MLTPSNSPDLTSEISYISSDVLNIMVARRKYGALLNFSKNNSVSFNVTSLVSLAAVAEVGLY